MQSQPADADDPSRLQILQELFPDAAVDFLTQILAIVDQNQEDWMDLAMQEITQLNGDYPLSPEAVISREEEVLLLDKIADIFPDADRGFLQTICEGTRNCEERLETAIQLIVEKNGEYPKNRKRKHSDDNVVPDYTKMDECKALSFTYWSQRYLGLYVMLLVSNV